MLRECLDDAAHARVEWDLLKAGIPILLSPSRRVTFATYRLIGRTMRSFALLCRSPTFLLHHLFCPVWQHSLVVRRSK